MIFVVFFPRISMSVLRACRHCSDALRFCVVVRAWFHCFLSSSCMIWFCCVSGMFSWVRIPLSMPTCPILI